MDLGRVDCKERVKRHMGILLSKPYRRKMKTQYNLAAAVGGTARRRLGRLLSG